MAPEAKIPQIQYPIVTNNGNLCKMHGDESIYPDANVNVDVNAAKWIAPWTDWCEYAHKYGSIFNKANRNFDFPSQIRVIRVY